MEVRDSIEKRRSIRKFKDIPVEPAIIRQLIEARRSRICCRGARYETQKENGLSAGIQIITTRRTYSHVTGKGRKVS